MHEKEFYERSDDFQESLVATDVSSPWRRLLNRYTPDRFERACTCLESGQDFLELGCGDGRLAALATRRYSRVHGIDIAINRLEKARNLCVSTGRPDQIGQFVVANLNEAFPFVDASMDAVAALSVLEHAFDVYSFIRECTRVLKTKGVLVLEVPNVAYFKNRLRLVLGRLPITSAPHGWAKGFGWDGGHLHYFTKRTVMELLVGEGFRVEQVRESRASFAKQRDRWVGLLAGNLLIKAVKL